MPIPSSINKYSQKVLLPVVAAIVTVTGVLLFAFSGASAPAISAEPETGTLNNGAGKINDAAASGGSAVSFGTAVTPGYVTVYDEQFSGTYTHAYSNNGTYPNFLRPNIFIEWSGALPLQVSNGTGKIANNSISGSSSKGFHRMFSTKKYGGPGMSMKMTTRVKMTKLYDDAGWGGFRGVKLGMKFPNSGTGYSEEDPLSVKGEVYGSNGPGSMIFVTGVMEDGRTELARNGYGDVGYLPFQYGPKIPYTLNTWKDITIQADWLPGTTHLRIRYWQNSTGTGTPIFDYTDTNTPFREPGFLWYRTDFSDFEYDYVRIEQKKL